MSCSARIMPKPPGPPSSSIDKVPGLRAVDAGSLSSAMAIEALTPVLLQVNARYKTRSSIRLTNLRLP